MTTETYVVTVIAANTNLTNRRVYKGEGYKSQIIADSGYSIYEVKITMGGLDITSSVYDATYQMIDIPHVTDTVTVEVYAMHSIPSDYIRVDGIKNPSNAWIDTAQKLGAKAIAYVDCTRGTATTGVGIFASRPTGVTSRLTCGIYMDGGKVKTISPPKNASGSSLRDLGVSPALGERFSVAIDKANGRIYYNNVLKATYATPNVADTYNMCLFAQCNQSPYEYAVNSAGYIIHFASIKNETSYARYYIPCLNASGVAGFWDAARGVFQGSGNSTAFKAILEGIEFDYITFEDSAVKQICVTNWGGHYKAGEISTVEAARVTNLGSAFKSNTTITKFNELRYFTGLTTLYISGSQNSSVGAFHSCTNLSEVTIPAAPIANLSGAFYYTNVETLDFSPITFVTTAYNVQRMQKVAASCPRLKTFIFPPNWRMNASDMCIYICLHQDPLLETVDTNGCDFSLMTYADRAQCFDSCPSLKRIIGGMPGLKNTITVDSSAFTHDACVELFNSLGTVTAARTIKISTATYNTLTAEEKAIATDKGWTLNYG